MERKLKQLLILTSRTQDANHVGITVPAVTPTENYLWCVSQKPATNLMPDASGRFSA